MEFKETKFDLYSKLQEELNLGKGANILIEVHNGICWYISNIIKVTNYDSGKSIIDSFDFNEGNIYIS